MLCHPVDEIHTEQTEVRIVSTKTNPNRIFFFLCAWNGVSGDLPTRISDHCIAHRF